MRRKISKLISVFLAIILAFSLSLSPAFAEDDTADSSSVTSSIEAIGDFFTRLFTFITSIFDSIGEFLGRDSCNQPEPPKTEPVKSKEELKEVLDTIEDGDTVYIGDVVIDEPVLIESDGVVIVGTEDTIFTEKLEIKADNVTLDTIKIQYEASGDIDADAPLVAKGKDISLNNCSIERTNDVAQAYGVLVDLGNGVLTAENTTFIAPYDPSLVGANSPSVINAEGGVYLDNCTIKTDGYAIFAQHVTKGIIKNTVFEGVDGRPCYIPVNSTMLDGLVFDNCTFRDYRSQLVLGGSFTIKNSTFKEFRSSGNGLYMGIYNTSASEPIVLENNTIEMDSRMGWLYLTAASWAPFERDTSSLSITGNTFTGTGRYAIRYNTNYWLNVNESVFVNNFNGNVIDTTAYLEIPIS